MNSAKAMTRQVENARVNPVRDVPYYRILDKIQAAEASDSAEELDAAKTELQIHKFRSMEAIERALRWASEQNPGAMRDRLMDLLGETFEGIRRDLEMARQREAELIREQEDMAMCIARVEKRVNSLEIESGGRA